VDGVGGWRPNRFHGDQPVIARPMFQIYNDGASGFTNPSAMSFSNHHPWDEEAERMWLEHGIITGMVVPHYLGDDSWRT